MAATQKTPAILVDKASKHFILPHERVRSIKQAFVNVLRRRNGSTAEVQRVLQNINFRIEPGQFVGIVGRNGSGKSTLLKMLAGIYQPSSGRIAIDGKLVPFIELGVGFNPELTGRENVYLNGALMGFSVKEVDAIYQDIVNFAELERFMDQKLKNYSSGMQVRLAFSVAIVAQADILLVDEVLAVGDADFQRKCFDYFKSLKKQKKTVVLVTHDMGAVREYCDRAILIDRGKLVADGTAESVAEKYIRLFAEDEVSDTAETGKKDNPRWGDGTVSVTEVELNNGKPVTSKQKEIVVTVRITVHQDIHDPVVGFSIKDAADTMICGTNTRIKQRRLGKLTAGDKRTVRFTMPNIFADGKHFVNATVEHDDGITVCDWWNEALAFRVQKKERTAYPITPPVDVAID
jgi:ABC-2 type transport system ATP-binding protein